MVDFLLIILAIALVFLNAFFVAAEFGMVKLRNTRVEAIKETYGLRGRILSNVHKHLDAYLSACQLGITLASLGLGWIGEPAFAHLLEPILLYMGIVSREIISVIAFFVAFSIISFLHIVIGELMPKSLAIRQSEKVSVWTAIPLYGFYWLMYPAIWLLNSCSNYLLKVSGLSETSRGEYFYSTDEIKLILGASHLHGEITKEEAEMLEHTLDFSDLRVTEVMRPLTEMVMLEMTESMEENLKTMMQHRYSRYPIYDKNKRGIIGIVHVKDLFSILYEKGEIKDLELLLRPVLKVSNRLPAIDLLQKFREGMPHFALIYNRSGTLIGFVTLDNLLHVLIGRIRDEFHRTKEDWIANSDGTFTVKGDCSIYSLEQALDRDIDTGSDDIETLGKFIMHQLDSVPKESDRFEFTEFDAVIEKMQNNQILIVKVFPK